MMRISPLISGFTQLSSYTKLTARMTAPFSYVKGSTFATPITGSTADSLRAITQRNPSKTALHSFDQGVSLSYQELLYRAEQLASGLARTFNLKPKDRIGIYSYNKWEWVVVQMAAAMGDFILVNINPAYQSDDLAYTIEKVGLRVLFTSDSFGHVGTPRYLDYLHILHHILPEMSNSGHSPLQLNSKAFPTLKAVVRFNSDASIKQGCINFSDLLQPIDRNLLGHSSAHDPANIQFTSGTTGKPKAATLSHYNILNNALLIGEKCRYTDQDNIAIPVPFYHCFGMIMGTLAGVVRGATSTIICQGFDPKKTLQAVDKYQCTSLYGVPTMFLQYLRHFQHDPKSYNISQLRTGIIAGALCSQALMTKIIQVLGLRDMTNCYGMTETSPVSFQTCPTDPFHRKTTTVGKILPGLQAKIVNFKGETCPNGEAGEFWVKGWSVMLNYWEDPVATEKSIENGWMKSGDLGVIDSEGYLSIVGRIKDMIIRGGENIYPKQIQEFLAKMPGILDAQVVGISDEKYGEEVAVVIKVKDLSNHPPKKAVYDFCHDHIAFYKIPKYVKFVTDYPLTVSGKVQKFIIRKQLEEESKSEKLEVYRIK